MAKRMGLVVRLNLVDDGDFSDVCGDEKQERNWEINGIAKCSLI